MSESKLEQATPQSSSVESANTNRAAKGLRVIFYCLMLWIGLIALGTVLFEKPGGSISAKSNARVEPNVQATVEAESASSNKNVSPGVRPRWQKPLVVVLPMMVMLGSWAWLLQRKSGLPRKFIS